MSQSKRKPAPAIPRYLEAAVAAAINARPGEVVHVEVRHERECAFLNDRGPCDCEAVAREIKPT